MSAIRDGEARQTLTELGSRFQETEKRLVEVLRAMPRLLAGKQAAKVITVEAEPLMAGAKNLSNAYEGAGNTTNFAPLSGGGTRNSFVVAGRCSRLFVP